MRNFFSGAGRLTHDAGYVITTKIVLVWLSVFSRLRSDRHACVVNTCVCACLVNTFGCVCVCVYVQLRLSVRVYLIIKERTRKKFPPFSRRRPFACYTTANFSVPQRFPRLSSRPNLE